MGQLFFCFVVSVVLLGNNSSATVFGALTKEQRLELSRMSREARTVYALVRRKQIKEAKALIEQLEQRVSELNIKDGERARIWTVLQRNLERARNAVPVSFESDVAPILSANCVHCHGADKANADLRLDTFDNLRRGGRGGRILQPGKPAISLIMARLTAADDRHRMPQNAERLKDAELKTLGKWIAAGAVFDGNNRDAPIGDSTRELPAAVTVVMANGSETVSFKDDVAPIIVNFCLRCHQGNNPPGNFSVATVEDVLRGGNTGSTIVPGDSGNSYLWKLVGLQDPIKMPPGQALLKRSQAITIKGWIDEGAHFDGDSPKATLRSIVPTADEMAAAKLTSISEKDFARRRIQQAAMIWKRVAPREQAESVTTDNFFTYGNVGMERLDYLARVAEAQIVRLQKRHNGDKNPWRGRIILFATKDRFEYTEFDTVIRKQPTPEAVDGHVIVTAHLDEAYIAFHDQNTPASTFELGTDQLLNSLVAQAWLARDGLSRPDWLQQGFGLTESGASGRFFSGLRPHVLRSVNKFGFPNAIFNNGTFPPEDVPIVGALLTRFLQSRGKTKFMEFVESAGTTPDAAQAITSIYGLSADSVAKAFITSLSR